MHKSAVTGWVNTALMLPRLEVQFPLEPRTLKRFGLCFLNTTGLQMDADVLAADLGYSCVFVILMMTVCLKSLCN